MPARKGEAGARMMERHREELKRGRKRALKKRSLMGSEGEIAGQVNGGEGEKKKS
jgi:hypothetical protein